MTQWSSLIVDTGVSAYLDGEIASAQGLLIGSVVGGVCFIVHRVALPGGLASRSDVKTACDEVAMHTPGGVGVVGVYALDGVQEDGLEKSAVVSMARAAASVLCGSFEADGDGSAPSAVLIQTSSKRGKRGVVAKRLAADAEMAVDIKVDARCAQDFVAIVASVDLSRALPQRLGGSVRSAVARAAEASARCVRGASATPSTGVDGDGAAPAAHFSTVDDVVRCCAAHRSGSGYAVALYGRGLGGGAVLSGSRGCVDMLSTLRVPALEVAAAAKGGGAAAAGTLDLAGTVACCAILHRSVSAAHITVALADDVVRTTLARFRAAGGGAAGDGALALPRRVFVQMSGGAWGCRYECSGDDAADRARCVAALGLESCLDAGAEWRLEANIPTAATTWRAAAAAAPAATAPAAAQVAAVASKSAPPPSEAKMRDLLERRSADPSTPRSGTKGDPNEKSCLEQCAVM
jgi:hypothetical protein